MNLYIVDVGELVRCEACKLEVLSSTPHNIVLYFIHLHIMYNAIMYKTLSRIFLVYVFILF